MFAAARPETGVRRVDMRYAAVVRARADTASDRCVSAIGIGSAIIIIIIIIIGPIIAIIISILRSSSGSSLLGGAVPARDSDGLSIFSGHSSLGMTTRSQPCG